MKKFLKNIMSFFKRLLNPVNISKIIIIFTVGFASRIFINEYFEINVFMDYLNSISIWFYLCFSIFIVLIHEFVNINIIPTFVPQLINFISNVLSFIFIKPFVYIYITLNPKVGVFNIDYWSTRVYYNHSTGKYSQERVLKTYNVQEEQGESSTAYENVNNQIESSNSPNRGYYYNNPNYYGNSYESNDYSFSSPINRDNEELYFVFDTIGNERNRQTPTYVDPQNLSNSRMRNIVTPSPSVTPVNFEEGLQYHNDGYPSNSALSNDTAHGTIGPNMSEDYINYNERKYRVIKALQTKTQPEITDNRGDITPPQVHRSFDRIPKPRKYVHEMTLNETPQEERGRLFEEIAQPLKTKEIDVTGNTVKGKLSLGIKYYHHKSYVKSVYIKYHDLAKRKFFWNIWEKNRPNYNSYEEFKNDFDPKTNIWKEISKTTKSDISREIKDLLDTNPFNIKHSNKISKSNIKGISTSSTQSRLNHIHANRYKSNSIYHSNKKK